MDSKEIVTENLNAVIKEALDCFDNPPVQEGEDSKPAGSDIESPASCFLAGFQAYSGMPELVTGEMWSGLVVAAIGGRVVLEKAMRDLAQMAIDRQPLVS